MENDFAVLDRLDDVVIRTDPDWRVAWVNRCALRRLAASGRGSPVGMGLWELLPSIDGNRAEAERTIAAGEAVVFDALLDDSGRWHEVQIEMIGSDIWLIGRDVHERRQTARELRDEVHRLVEQVSNAESQERERLAKFIHDDLQQLIVAAQLSLQRALKLVEGLPAHGALTDAVHLMNDAREASQTLAADLHPTVLHHEGLVPALQWLAKRVADMHGLEVHVQAQEGRVAGLGSVERLVLYDAAREALFNVVKHSGAREAWVEVLTNAVRIEVQVLDRGKGIQNLPKATGYGLTDLRQRVHAVGGCISPEPLPGGGTIVRAIVPLGHVGASVEA